MPKSIPFARLAIGLCAGLVAALLFVIPVKGTLMAVLLAYFAPLPIMIAALGWGHLTGLLAALAGAAALGVSVQVLMAPLFAIGLALPAWWLARLALLANAAPAANGAQAPALRWYPLGAIVVWAATLSASVAIIGCVGLAFAYGSYGAALDAAARAITPVLEAYAAQIFSGETASGANPAADLARFLLRLAPAALAGSNMLMLLVNLWLAARIVQMSNRLPRSWTPIPEAIHVPSLTAAVFALALAACAARGLTSALGMSVAAASGLTLALQGLAILHAHSRGRSWRMPMLIVLYSVALVVTPLPFVLALIVGMADILFRFARKGAAPASPQT